ncbi:MAG: sugar-binding transcriptional regulator [Thiotrichales bacterium]|nr:sugar-binding transcriptional regulator [Thiotrichales bacterium]MCY4285958.1 sugar-binding transcriptional regulator [Thiotrichales bacterium]
MNAVDRARVRDQEASLSARAAWLYFSGRMTQSEIAKRLGVPSTKAHRLIARATREGLVRVFVDADVSECVALEESLTARYGLDHCRVAPDLAEGRLPLRTLGLAGASYLRDLLERRVHACIGVGQGRTLSAVVKALPSMHCPDVAFVSLIGGLTRKFAANPYDVIHGLAEKTGAEAYLLPVPLFAKSAADKKVLMAQAGIGEVFAMSRAASLLLVGVGEVDGHAHLSETGMVGEDEIADLRASGAAGEILGYYFDGRGRRVASGLYGRAMSPDIEALKERTMVAVAGGVEKVEAVRAVLRSGLLDGLITDEATGRSLIEGEPVTAPSNSAPSD